MLKTLKELVLVSLIAVIGIVFVSPAAFAQKDAVCDGVKAAGGGCTDTGAVNTLIENVVNVLSAIVGIVGVIMIIYAGFKYITAAGDAGSISSAKTTVIYALVGLVIAAMAQVIVGFVLDKTP